MIRDLKPYSAYKESGLTWLREIPVGWEVRRNGRLFAQRNETGHENLPILEVSLRRGVKVRNFADSDRKQVMADPKKYKRAAKGDLAYNMMRMWQGAMGVSPVDGLVSPAYVVARPLSGVETRYYTYLFRTDACLTEVDKISRGIVKDRNRLYWEDFKRIPSLFPPPEEQTAIVRFLDDADRRIRRAVLVKKRLIALINEQKQVIVYKAVTQGLDPDAQLKPSGVEWLGDVPEHWGMRRLKTLCHMKSGEGITALSINEEGDYPVYGGNGIRGYTSEYTHDGVFVLIGRQGALCGNVRTAQGKFWASEHAVVASLCRDHNLAWFAAILGAMNLNQYSIAAAQPGLSVERILNLSLPVPPQQEQELIAEYIAMATVEMTTAIEHTLHEIELLLEFRARLVSDVVTGKLDVREAAAKLSTEMLTRESADDTEAILDDEDIPEDADTEEVEA